MDLASSCEAALRTRRMAVFVAKKAPFFLWSDGPTWSIGDLWAIDMHIDGNFHTYISIILL
jgi:hypothetical protein